MTEIISIAKLAELTGVEGELIDQLIFHLADDPALCAQFNRRVNATRHNVLSEKPKPTMTVNIVDESKKGKR